MGEQVFNINFVRTVRRYPCVYDHGRLDYCLRHVTESAWTEIAKEVGEDVKTCKEKWKNLRTVFRRNLLKDGGATKRPYYLNEHMQFMIPLLHGAKKRGRSWANYQRLKEEGAETPWEDLSFPDDDEEDGMDDEDPLLMVETVIKRESPVEREEQEERPSTTQLKADPGRRRSAESGWGGGPRAAGAVEAADPGKADEEVEEQERHRKRFKPLQGEASAEDPARQHNLCLESADTQFLLSLKPDLEQMTPRQKRKFKKEIFSLLDSIMEDQSGEASHYTTNLPSSTSRFTQKK